MHIYRFQFSGQPAEILVVAKTLKDAQKKVAKEDQREPAAIQRLNGSKVLV